MNYWCVRIRWRTRKLDVFSACRPGRVLCSCADCSDPSEGREAWEHSERASYPPCERTAGPLWLDFGRKHRIPVWQTHRGAVRVVWGGGGGLAGSIQGMPIQNGPLWRGIDFKAPSHNAPVVSPQNRKNGYQQSPPPFKMWVIPGTSGEASASLWWEQTATAVSRDSRQPPARTLSAPRHELQSHTSKWNGLYQHNDCCCHSWQYPCRLERLPWFQE